MHANIDLTYPTLGTLPIYQSLYTMQDNDFLSDRLNESARLYKTSC